MTKRLNGKSGQYPRDPLDWYREPRSTVEQLAVAIDFEDALIWDPSCGMGNILDVFKERGHWTFGSDVVDRDPRHKFQRGNFLRCQSWPRTDGRPLSIVCNPPYGYQPDIGERFVQRALDLVPFRRAAFLLPIEFLAGQGRRKRLYSQRAPSHVAICSERPSMPPGAAVVDMGDKAFTGGMADYCWIVWTAGGPYRTETIFLEPSEISAAPKSSGRVRGSQRPGASA